MKIVHVIGGLGNQMFQYAFAIALKQAFPEEQIKLDVSSFAGYPLHNGYELSRVFNVQLPYANLWEIALVAWPLPGYRLWQLGNKILPLRSSMVRDRSFPEEFEISDVSKYSYFTGYWGQSKFFDKYRSFVLKALEFPPIDDDDNRAAVDFIMGKPTAFIHVRRGDYINHPTLGGICTKKYYQNAISRIRKKIGINRFIVFSNDIDWCKNNLKSYLSDSDVLFVNWNKGNQSFRDMQLMAMCRAAIIANSSFSYWGAWLSEAEIILRPGKWTMGDGSIEDVLPDRWEKVSID